MSGDLSCSIFVQLPRPQKLKNSLRRFFYYKNNNTYKEENLTFSEKNYNEEKYFYDKDSLRIPCSLTPFDSRKVVFANPKSPTRVMLSGGFF